MYYLCSLLLKSLSLFPVTVKELMEYVASRDVNSEQECKMFEVSWEGEREGGI
jgi:hypothetical protein